MLSDNYPFYNPIYQEAIEEIKAGLTEKSSEGKVLALRLARALPLMFRIKLIEMCENVGLRVDRKSL